MPTCAHGDLYGLRDVIVAVKKAGGEKTTMRTTITLTWVNDISMGEYADALREIALAIHEHEAKFANVRSVTDCVSAREPVVRGERKQTRRRKKREVKMDVSDESENGRESAETEA